MTPDQLKAEVADVIADCEDGKRTHELWAEWFTEHPKDPRKRDLGDAKFHRRQVRVYDRRIRLIRALVAENERLLGAIPRPQMPPSREVKEGVVPSVANTSQNTQSDCSHGMGWGDPPREYSPRGLE